jgi:hypothetical protein
MKAAVQQTRGLNRTFNHTLKRIFKGRGDNGDWPGRRRSGVPSLRAALGRGTKPNLAKLTIARQIAAIVLALWRSGEASSLKGTPSRSPSVG